MVCGGPLLYNFTSASGRDDIVFGSARPGAKQQRCYDVKDVVAEHEVVEWVEHMKAAGIVHVVSLLTASELATYHSPPVQIMKQHGLQAVALDSTAPGAYDELLAQLDAAFKANEKVLVHCWGGGGRTGVALAAWLCHHYGLSDAEAAQEVTEHAKQMNASRRCDAEGLAKFRGGQAS